MHSGGTLNLHHKAVGHTWKRVSVWILIRRFLLAAAPSNKEPPKVTILAERADSVIIRSYSLLGCQHRIRCVRADSGFYGDHFLSFLEERGLPFIVVARLTRCLKS